ncbi:MAG: tetratricopeptide repeat protein [candidate division KSB1 bacterium]|nr:tetratricopeptide repeat protein [candidate division KSB1 bacterium]
MKQSGIQSTIFLVAGMILVMTVGCGEQLTEQQLLAKVQDFQDSQQWEKVADTYDTLLQSYPESDKAPEYMYNLGMVYSNNLQDYDKAVETWEQLLEQYPDSHLLTNTKFMIGYCYANNIQDLDKAREKYQAFLQKHPDHELAPSVKWELDHLGQDISDIELELNANVTE